MLLILLVGWLVAEVHVLDFIILSKESDRCTEVDPENISFESRVEGLFPSPRLYYLISVSIRIHSRGGGDGNSKSAIDPENAYNIDVSYNNNNC